MCPESVKRSGRPHRIGCDEESVHRIAPAADAPKGRPRLLSVNVKVCLVTAPRRSSGHSIHPDTQPDGPNRLDSVP